MLSATAHKFLSERLLNKELDFASLDVHPDALKVVAAFYGLRTFILGRSMVQQKQAKKERRYYKSISVAVVEQAGEGSAPLAVGEAFNDPDLMADDTDSTSSVATTTNIAPSASASPEPVVLRRGASTSTVRTSCSPRASPAGAPQSQPPSKPARGGSASTVVDEAERERVVGLLLKAQERIRELEGTELHLKQQVSELSREVATMTSKKDSEADLTSELQSRLLLMGNERQILVERADNAITAQKEAETKLSDAKSAFTKDLEVARVQLHEWQGYVAEMQEEVGRASERQQDAVNGALLTQRRQYRLKMMNMLQQIEDESGEFSRAPSTGTIAASTSEGRAGSYSPRHRQESGDTNDVVRTSRSESKSRMVPH